MQLKPETVAALEQLYGSSSMSEPVCAADESAALLWANQESAAQLLQQLRGQLTGSTVSGVPAIPQTGEFLLRDALPATLCSSRMLYQDGVPFYVLQFRSLPDDRRMSPPEFRALLDANNRVCGEAARKVIRAVSELEMKFEESAETAEIRNACDCILRQQFCGEELLWYETAEPDGAALLPPADISAVVQRFTEQLSEAACGWFAVSAEADAPACFSRVSPDRLETALLCIFIAAQNGAPDRTGCALSVSRRDAFVEIRMAFRPYDTPSDPLLHPLLPDATIVSEDVLTARFCAYFGAELICDGDARVLRLPAAEPDGLEPTLCAPAQEEPRLSPAYSQYTALLTRIRSMEMK